MSEELEQWNEKEFKGWTKSVEQKKIGLNRRKSIGLFKKMKKNEPKTDLFWKNRMLHTGSIGSTIQVSLLIELNQIEVRFPNGPGRIAGPVSGRTWSNRRSGSRTDTVESSVRSASDNYGSNIKQAYQESKPWIKF